MNVPNPHGPMPESDAGLTPDQLQTAIHQAAEKAFWEAGGVTLYRAPFEAAIDAAVGKYRELVER